MIDTPPSLAELNRVHMALTDDERLNLLEELLCACSLGWPQVVSVLECYVLDHEVRETLEGLPEV
jgi:hypothetical protein